MITLTLMPGFFFVEERAGRRAAGLRFLIGMSSPQFTERNTANHACSHITSSSLGRKGKQSFSYILAPPLIQELGARNNRLHQAAERVLIRGQARLHNLERLPVRELQTAAQRVGQQLLAQVIDEIVLPFFLQVL